MGGFSFVLAKVHAVLGSSLVENLSNKTFSLRVSQILPVTLPEPAGLAQLTSSPMPFVPVLTLWKQLLP